MDANEIKAAGLPATINTEVAAGYLFNLGHEMQRIPKAYRDPIFKNLKAIGTSKGMPPEVGVLLGMFMAGWMDYPS